MIATHAKEFAPPYFFVEKKIIGTFEECQEMVTNIELNDSIDRIHSLIEKGISLQAKEIDFIDSLVLKAYREVFPIFYIH